MEIESIPMNPAIIRRIKEAGITLEEYMVLVAKLAGYKWLVHYHVTDEVYNSLIKKGFLTPTRLLSADGTVKIRDIIGLVDIDGLKKLKKEFEEFWEEFPSSDAHKHFPKTRVIKQAKESCFTLYARLRQKYSKEDIINGIREDVRQRKEASIYENKLTFLPNPKRWLTEKRFLNYISQKNENKNSNNIVSDII